METPPYFSPNSDDLLLVNPVAGGGRAAAILPSLRKFANDQKWNVEICVTQSPDDLAAKARQAAQVGRKCILVLGGDGTFQLLLNAVAEYPQTVLGVIPAGGGNDLAAALGLPSDPIRAAELLRNREVHHLDVVRVRTADGAERFYAGGGGIGLDAQAARYANGVFRNLPGRARYVLAAFRALFGFHAMKVRVSTGTNGNAPLESSALITAVFNTPSYGAGVCLAPGAKVDDGNLELVFVENLNLIQILRLLPAFAARGQLNTNRIRRFSVKCVRIETDSPCLFQGDGELLGLTPLEISVVPRAVRVLRPALNSHSARHPHHR